jgi:hypothetical protein
MIEAQAHLEVQALDASKRSLSSKFFRQREVLILKPGGGSIDKAFMQEYCYKGIWYHTDRIPSFNICPNCRNELKEGDISCLTCGEIVE